MNKKFITLLAATVCFAACTNDGSSTVGTYDTSITTVTTTQEATKEPAKADSTTTKDSTATDTSKAKTAE